MQEIQTEATIGMFRDKETIQNKPTTRQTKIYQAFLIGALTEWLYTSGNSLNTNDEGEEYVKTQYKHVKTVVNMK